jgi:hypothetical protein
MISAATSLIGALAGAWGGVFLGFRKVRRERAFEKQLAWHEDIADNLYCIASSLNRIALRKDKRSLKTGEWDTLNKEIDRLAILGPKARLYATRGSYARVGDVMRGMQDIVKPLASVSPPDDDEEKAAQILTSYNAAFFEMVKLVGAAAYGVSDDVRKQLGVEPIKRRSWEKVWKATKQKTSKVLARTSTTE